MKMIKVILLLGLFSLATLGVLAILNVIPQEQAIDFGFKVFGVLFILVLLSGAIQMVLGRAKPDDKGPKPQGPQF